MALLDTIRGLGRKASQNLESYVGGLLGEDYESLSKEEKDRLRREALMSIFESMASNATSPRSGLEQVATRTRERISGERATQDVQQAAANLAARATGRAGDVGRQTRLEEVTPMSGMSAVGMAATPAGMAALKASPVLESAVQESIKPDEYVYQNVPGVGLVAVNRRNPNDRRVIQREVRQRESVQPTLRQVRLANGMVQDMWISPGQASGTPVGVPYMTKGAGGEGETLNARQQSGISMTRDAAYTYASNLTGMSKEELQKKSPAEIEQLIKQRGGRVLQGGTARTLAGLPVVGDFARTLIESANADLIGPSTTGGAGIAMLQNPTGPITGADVTTGTMQFPNPMLPADVQAQMIRSILEQGGRVERYDRNGNPIK